MSNAKTIARYTIPAFTILCVLIVSPVIVVQYASYTTEVVDESGQHQQVEITGTSESLLGQPTITIQWRLGTPIYRVTAEDATGKALDSERITGRQTTKTNIQCKKNQPCIVRFYDDADTVIIELVLRVEPKRNLWPDIGIAPSTALPSNLPI